MSTLQSCDKAVGSLMNESSLQKALNSAQADENKQLQEQISAEKKADFLQSPTVMVPLGIIIGILVDGLVHR